MRHHEQYDPWKVHRTRQGRFADGRIKLKNPLATSNGRSIMAIDGFWVCRNSVGAVSTSSEFAILIRRAADVIDKERAFIDRTSDFGQALIILKYCGKDPILKPRRAYQITVRVSFVVDLPRRLDGSQNTLRQRGIPERPWTPRITARRSLVITHFKDTYQRHNTLVRWRIHVAILV